MCDRSQRLEPRPGAGAERGTDGDDRPGAADDTERQQKGMTEPEQIELAEVATNIYEIPRDGKMRVPVRVYGSKQLVGELQRGDDQTLTQGRNVATLPGIRKFAVVLPDGHQGYGFPIGGVAAVDTETGVISPGGIGFRHQLRRPTASDAAEVRRRRGT